MSAPLGSVVLHVALAGAFMAQVDGIDLPLTVPHCEGHCTLTDFEAVALEREISKSETAQGYLQEPRPWAIQSLGGRQIRATLTAYTHTGNRTASGVYPTWGMVAVDPRLIPLGSRLAIEGYPGQVFIAADTGGGVHGAHIDIFMGSYSDAIRFGRQTRTVTVLR